MKVNRSGDKQFSCKAMFFEEITFLKANIVGFYLKRTISEAKRYRKLFKASGKKIIKLL